MSKRLQVVLDDREMREIQSLAERQRMSLSAWVRQTLRAAREQEPTGDSSKKIAAVRSAAKHRFPTAEIGQMVAEIESGYGAE